MAKGKWGWEEEGKRGEMGTSAIVPATKIKKTTFSVTLLESAIRKPY